MCQNRNSQICFAITVEELGSNVFRKGGGEMDHWTMPPSLILPCSRKEQMLPSDRNTPNCFDDFVAHVLVPCFKFLATPLELRLRESVQSKPESVSSFNKANNSHNDQANSSEMVNQSDRNLAKMTLLAQPS